jgi:hypothetical protein
MLDDMRFTKTLKNFTDSDKVELMKQFRIQKVLPGQRIFDQKSEKIDRFALILRGKVGIYYPD